MIILKVILLVISVVVFFYLVLPLILTLLSLLVEEKPISQAEEETDFACIITAYRNVQIAKPLVDSLLKQEYKHHIVYVVADECDISDFQFSDEKVILLRPPQKLGSKVKSILHAIDHFKRDHQAIIIFDPDNLAKPDFLSILNNYLHAGFKAVQGRRVAKNLDTIYACADATGEIYKNYVERYAPYLLGSSPTIAGSGMAVETKLFQTHLKSKRITESLQHDKVIVAEDKILQNDLVNKGYQIAFAYDAILYDEKVTTAAQVERQRSRWLYSYFENLPNTIEFAFKGLKSFNANQFIFSLTTSVPPLFILLLSAGLLMIINFFLSTTLALLLLSGILIFCGNILLTLALSKAPKEIWNALWGIPLFVFNQFLALLKMKRSKKDFLHTQHKNTVSIDEVLNNEEKIK